MNRQTKTEAIQAEVDVITNQCEFGSVLKGIRDLEVVTQSHLVMNCFDFSKLVNCAPLPTATRSN